ncbi:MAG: PDZ domain-containing protein [Actinobacteria bacterium]|nr:PDZ domain-containing protein [Actinomycetota bacterium]MCA1722023.1 PDZ domain-containing protein [Actinomycetota bacterium]
MTRRTLTLLLAGVLVVGLTLVAAVASVPYVALAPGPTYNTLGSERGTPVIAVQGRRTYEDNGHLNMTTISVVTRLTLVQALRGWFQHDLAVVPRDIIYPPDQSDEEVRAEDQEAMRESQDAATTAALRQLGVPGTTHVVVGSVTAKAPADGKLKAKDELTAVDGMKVTGSKQLRELIGRRMPGQPVQVRYLRGGQPGEVTLTTSSTTDADGTVRPVIGVQTSERTDYPVKVTISLRDVGGPSAGLMFALGILDKLEPGSLTNGRFIAGTGTIDGEGAVGPIGGIQQKLIGARSKGAEVFLVPAANCAEALSGPPKGLKLVKVATLKGALAELRKLQTGGATTPCTS